MKISDLLQQLNDEKYFTSEGNEIINDSQLICLWYEDMYASPLFNETIKTWQKKKPNKIYAEFFPFMTQQQDIVSVINQHPEQKVS